MGSFCPSRTEKPPGQEWSEPDESKGLLDKHWIEPCLTLVSRLHQIDIECHASDETRTLLTPVSRSFQLDIVSCNNYKSHREVTGQNSSAVEPPSLDMASSTSCTIVPEGSSLTSNWPYMHTRIAKIQSAVFDLVTTHGFRPVKEVEKVVKALGSELEPLEEDFVKMTVARLVRASEWMSCLEAESSDSALNRLHMEIQMLFKEQEKIVTKTEALNRDYLEAKKRIQDLPKVAERLTQEIALLRWEKAMLLKCTKEIDAKLKPKRKTMKALKVFESFRSMSNLQSGIEDINNQGDFKLPSAEHKLKTGKRQRSKKQVISQEQQLEKNIDSDEKEVSVRDAPAIAATKLPPKGTAGTRSREEPISKQDFTDEKCGSSSQQAEQWKQQLEDYRSNPFNKSRKVVLEVSTAMNNESLEPVEEPSDSFEMEQTLCQMDRGEEIEGASTTSFLRSSTIAPGEPDFEEEMVLNKGLREELVPEMDEQNRDEFMNILLGRVNAQDSVIRSLKEHIAKINKEKRRLSSELEGFMEVALEVHKTNIESENIDLNYSVDHVKLRDALRANISGSNFTKNTATANNGNMNESHLQREKARATLQSHVKRWNSQPEPSTGNGTKLSQYPKAFDDAGWSTMTIEKVG